MNALKNETNLVAKNDKLFTLKIHPSKLKEKTGCMLPCDTIEYSSQVFSHVHRENAVDPANKFFADVPENENGSIFILTRVESEKIPVDQEYYRYSFVKFVSDSGGIVGIFVGCSFWSIYELMIEPFYYMMVKISKK